MTPAAALEATAAATGPSCRGLSSAAHTRTAASCTQRDRGGAGGDRAVGNRVAEAGLKIQNTPFSILTNFVVVNSPNKSN